MTLTGRDKLAQFIKKYADAKSALESWEILISNNSFSHFPNLKQTFGSADFVKPYTVFDIKGNHYRLVTIISYQTQICVVDEVMTHKDYDKWNEAK